ncbi:Na+/H+ antiporter NhaC [Emcibacter nanhaiensis]|uniref:Na+/H+ antiporter NhaC n=1 Tax=Emcibacter nanhaiensis TaxID=1505037 RepID=A0A501PLX2_9PROT|nr:Na+/H+ antiporter NhaC [Emcibacter nanhaiensis]TPD61423.1 Na+/H+ antiporter NhaC [Emcibacter nanhaiensis]
MTEETAREPSLLDAIIPVVFLIILLTTSVLLYQDESSYGPNQIALILAGGIALLVGWKNGVKWRTMEKAISRGIGNTVGALLILLMVGALIGTWILSGTVPAMIYYGLQVINPSVFYFTACILCAITSMSIGSSWTTASTVGIGLMGIASGLGLPLEITAGAVISGAYFGDKMSPLSDTTNLAPAITGTDLFTHIRHMMWTTGPAISLALILFLVIGLTQEPVQNNISVEGRLLILDQNFSIGPHLFIPMVVVFYLAYKKYPAFPTLMFGAILGGIMALIFQQATILKFVGDDGLMRGVAMFKGVWTALFDGYNSQTGNEEMDSLLSRGGMANMLNTIWLIMCAITFGSILEHLGMLQKLVVGLLGLAKSTGSLILITALTCFGINVIAMDQYIAIVLPGRMYRIEFERRKLAAKNLSRVLEDTATVTSVLVPWNTCGAFMSATLGIATLAYAPYCFFNILSPIISVIYGYTNFKITPMEEEEVAAE